MVTVGRPGQLRKERCIAVICRVCFGSRQFLLLAANFPQSSWLKDFFKQFRHGYELHVMRLETFAANRMVGVCSFPGCLRVSILLSQHRYHKAFLY